MKTKILSLITVGVCLLGLLAQPACRQLDASGPYQSDQVLYSADLAITTSYDLMHVFVSWENDNRAALTAYPEIKTAADTVRKDGKQWIGTAMALRDAYKANPTAENQAALETSLNVLRTAITQASGYMAQAAAPKARPAKQPPSPPLPTLPIPAN